MEKLKEKILEESNKGNIIIADFEGLKITLLDEFIKQPAEGILYDLNRIEPVVLSFLDSPKWINDFAVAKVIRKLKDRIEELENK